MRWTDRPPEALTLPIEAFLHELPGGPVREQWTRRLALAGLEPGTPWVVVERRAVEEALQAVADVATERGGLLIGRFHAPDPSVAEPVPTLVHVRGAVAGAGAESTLVSLRLPASTWEAARARLEAGERVVGWFHSHPGFGAFFSDTDRATQAAFFRAPGCLGWVIDPVRGEQAWFAGAQARELPPQQIRAPFDPP
jgi:proteasome lid subunit RPN8/RPN11